MSDYRRCYVPGGSFFFTVVTERRAGILANDRARDCLRAAIRYCKDQWPFHIDALVILPDHIHAIWTMPQDDADYSKRWGIIKKNFTENWLALGGTEQPVTASRLRYRRRGVWQPRFWEHTLSDERDYQNHFDYLHFNPVKHGLMSNVSDWPYSSFHHWVSITGVRVNLKSLLRPQLFCIKMKLRPILAVLPADLHPIHTFPGGLYASRQHPACFFAQRAPQSTCGTPSGPDAVIVNIVVA